MKYDLDRFKIAQENCYKQVLEEIKTGRKESHWMWYIFPQLSGLGRSKRSKKYEIANIEEAEYYLSDELLAKRLLELTRILAYEIEGKTIDEIFEFPDNLKFHSSMTLFYLVVISNRQFENDKDYFCFEDAIKKYYNGSLDKLTVESISSSTLFAKETPYQFSTSSVDQDNFNFRLEYINIQPADKWKPPVGTLIVQNRDGQNLAQIDNAMGPLCWSSDKKIVVTPICKMHWLKGFHQRFVVINFENGTIKFLKNMYKGEPRIIEKIEGGSFYFKHINKDQKVVEGIISIDNSEIDTIISFKVL
jgi:uncharacterized protein (DUF1810 family)